MYLTSHSKAKLKTIKRIIQDIHLFTSCSSIKILIKTQTLLIETALIAKLLLPLKIKIYLFSDISVPFSHSVMSDSATPWTAAHQVSLSIINSQSLLKLKFIESVMSSNHFILCCPLLLPPSIFPSIRVFSNESVLHIRWPKYWSFIFNISPSNEYSGLTSFRMDWLGLLAIQGTLKSSPTPQFKSISS